MKITVGADPELFLVNKQGKYRSAHGIIPGDKKNPFKVSRGAVQVDGMALEYNIDPANDVEEFVFNNQVVMSELRNMVPDKYDFSIVPSCVFHATHMKKQPPEAVELGCEPDYNAYTLATNPRPDGETTLRTASGHIHIGFCDTNDPHGEEHMIRCATLVKQLDYYLGVPSLFWDKDTRRRSLYGKAGAFRPKTYGLEYRVLSNAWLLSEERMRFVYNATVIAVEDLIQGSRAGVGLESWEPTAQKVLNLGSHYGYGVGLVPESIYGTLLTLAEKEGFKVT